MLMLAVMIPSLDTEYWFEALNLQDAYFHIVMHPTHRPPYNSSLVMTATSTKFFPSVFWPHWESSQNTITDTLSRHFCQDHEWELSNLVFEEICLTWGFPEINLFTTLSNLKCWHFCSTTTSTRILLPIFFILNPHTSREEACLHTLDVKTALAF